MTDTHHLPNPAGTRRILAVLAAFICVAVSESRASDTPFNEVSAQYLGVINASRPFPFYDLRPNVIYNHDNSTKRFEMWWLGRYNPADEDLEPSNLNVGDRIYYSFSSNGSDWSPAAVAYKGRGGIDGKFASDDHLVGSPAIIKQADKYYMFYNGNI